MTINTGMYKRGSGWWTGGEPFDGNPDIQELMGQCGMDYKVHKLPTQVQLGDETITFNNKHILVRERTNWDDSLRPLRQVGNKYWPMQNDFMGELISPLQKEWNVQSVGVAKRGRIVFIQLDLGGFDVGGNPNEGHTQYLLIGNDHLQGSIFYAFTNKRLVCDNMWNSIISGMPAIPHSRNAKLEMEFITAIHAHTILSRKQEQKALNDMFTRKLVKGDVNTFVQKLFPEPKPGRAMRLFENAPAIDHSAVTKMGERAKNEETVFETAKQRVETQRQNVVNEFFTFNDAHPYAANTAYALFNAVTATTSHGIGYTGSPAKQEVSRMFGGLGDINQRAWELAKGM